MSKAISKSGITSFMLVAAACLLVTSVVGCGKSDATGTVKGKVTLDGEAFSNGEVILVSMDSGKGANAALSADGSFAVTDPIPVGKYKAYIGAKEDPEMIEKMKQGLPTAVEMGKGVPPKYGNEADTDLEVKVEEGENEVTLEMKS